MREIEGHKASLFESWPQEHRAFVSSFLNRVKTIAQVTEIAGASFDNGQRLIIVSTVQSDDEAVWDRIWEAEYEVGHEFEPATVTFLELDNNQDEGPTDVDYYLEKGIEFIPLFKRE